MSIFSPRLTYTDTNTLDYYTTANIFYGATEWGYNPATGTYEYLSLWMPNCTAYAYGRFNELAHEHTLNYRWPSGNGEDWWTQAPGKGLSRGQTPALGAAMSWTYTDGSEGGHVAIVEKMIYDSSNNLIEIVTSNSAWNGYNPPRYPQNAFPWFYLEHINPNNLDHHANQHFQGFIYHPDFPEGGMTIDVETFLALIHRKKKERLKQIYIERRRGQ